MSTPPPTPRGDHIPPEILSSEVPIGRELGILFGFLIASLVIMSVYAVVWRAIERREEERDRLRREKLVARGVHHGRGGIHEKMLDQEVFMGRAELPVHGSRSQSRTRREEGDEDEARARTGERMINGGSGGRTRATSNSIPMAM